MQWFRRLFVRNSMKPGSAGKNLRNGFLVVGAAVGVAVAVSSTPTARSQADCFEKLTADAVMSQARRAAGYGPWADDVIHDTLIAVCTSPKRIRDVRPYFVRSVRNGARAAQQAEWFPGTCSLGEATCPLRSQDDEFERVEGLRLAERALCTLDSDSRAMLELSFDGVRHREIGQRFGITEDSARQRVKRARDSVKMVVEALCN
ncbi:MAG: sigma-70 family RNA polymerase sigma factor [Archangium sp.]|nr:sigma-70 family RNA polymerase sigma factor [Archangium sp.]